MLVSQNSDVKKKNTLDPRIKRTRKLLSEAFVALLGEKDFQSITVHDIAERAEVNRATFYAHFEDKYALLADSVRDSLQTLYLQRQPEPQTFTMENLRLLTATVHDFMKQFNGNCHLNLQNNDSMFIASQVQRHVYETLLKWLSKADPSPVISPITPEHAAMTISWVILGTSIEITRVENSQPSPEASDQMLAFLAMGLDAYLWPQAATSPTNAAAK
jgi:AcrR family transcriptional regulator